MGKIILNIIVIDDNIAIKKVFLHPFTLPRGHVSEEVIFPKQVSLPY